MVFFVFGCRLYNIGYEMRQEKDIGYSSGFDLPYWLDGKDIPTGENDGFIITRYCIEYYEDGWTVEIYTPDSASVMELGPDIFVLIAPDYHTRFERVGDNVNVTYYAVNNFQAVK